MASAPPDFPDHPAKKDTYRQRQYPANVGVLLHGLTDKGKGKVKIQMEFMNAESDLPVNNKGKLDGTIEVIPCGNSFLMEVKDKDGEVRFKYRLMDFPSEITAKPTAKLSDGKYVDIELNKAKSTVWPNNRHNGPETRLTSFDEV